MDSPATRIVFWSEEGVAARVFVLNEEGSYGRISTVIYFPPLSLNDFTESWLYVYTVSGQSDEIPREELENLYGVENPFDFNVMIATITAQPTRTPIPTFTPRATENLSATSTP